MPIIVLASEQSKATSVTADKVIKLLNYCNTHPETKIRYHASYMILHIHSDASYLSENEAKSRAGGFFYMGISINTNKKFTNRAILIFINAKEGTVLRTTLEDWKNYGINIPPNQWKQTIPLPQDTAMVQSNKNSQKPWICAFIG
jgi:hypothetical protein